MDDAPSPEFLTLQSAIAGRYSLEKELGRGGMGIVFLARDVALERLVAIKLLPPSMAKQAALRQRFLREARTAAKLSHPNIVPIFAVEEVGEFVFFVMAYVEGESLGERVSHGGPLRPGDATPIMRDISWALAYAHAQDVVHRDIKPDNILLEKGTGRALVADFGIARVGDGAPGGEIAEVLGTPEFMSPEQATGEPVDARSDIYSLGVTAFYALSGRPVFQAESPSETLAQHISAAPPRLASLVPGVPRRLSTVIERCLAKEPADRIQNGEELAEAFVAALEAKKETPLAVRLFVKKTRERQDRGHNIVYPLSGVYIGGGLMLTGPSEVQLIGLGIITAFGSVPVLSLLRRIRRVVSAGYGQPDVVLAFEEDLGSLDEELSFLYGDNYVRTGKRWRNVAFGAIGTGILGIFAIFAGALEAGFFASTASAVTAMVAAVQSQKRSTKRASRRVKFWRNRFGKWLFKSAGYGIKVQSEATGVTSRPTEIAIGVAVSGLFHSLPKATRESMADLPGIVEKLEADAHRLRLQVEEFDELLSMAGNAGAAPATSDEDSLAGQRHRATERIRAARDKAQRQFAQTVAALENLRVDLLRMRAGTMNLESVTANLGTAQELGAQIDRLLDAHSDIEASLEAVRD
ncbi:MAG: serine/threonine-protein kinase [Gemmatimonadetes bacterium]|nr:serine/threonine-protein kinase [Gemmatimonadota bacterium]